MDISIELAYQAGRSAYANGYAKDANPWPAYSARAQAWDEGWQDGHDEYYAVMEQAEEHGIS